MEKIFFELLLNSHGSNRPQIEDLKRCIQFITVFPFCEQLYPVRTEHYKLLSIHIRRCYKYSEVWGTAEISEYAPPPGTRTVRYMTPQADKIQLEFKSSILDREDWRLNVNKVVDFAWVTQLSLSHSPQSNDDDGMVLRVNFKDLDLNVVHIDHSTYLTTGGSTFTRFDPLKTSTNILKIELGKQRWVGYGSDAVLQREPDKEVDLQYIRRPGIPVPFRTFEEALLWVSSHIRNKMELIS